MADDTLPPVGATVVDADGFKWTFVGDLAGRSWQTRYFDGNWRVAESGEVAPLCSALWRSEQELAALRALAREAKERLATPDWMSASFDIADRLAALAKETTK